MGVTTQVFSLGDYRRRQLGGAQELPKDYFTNGTSMNSVFVPCSNLDNIAGEKTEATNELRKKIKDACENLIFDFFDSERGQVAIYDANNGTKASRKALGEKFEKEGVHVIFLGVFYPQFESLCWRFM